MDGKIIHYKGTKHPANFPLTQIEYRSFLKTIPLLHYEHSHHTIASFEKSLTQDNSGFVCRLESKDPFINEDGSEKLPVPDGDEVPAGFTEVAYLKNIFRDRDPKKKSERAQGSALGFRLLDEDRIEWFCFRRDVNDLLKVQTERGPMFDLVGYIERGDPNVNYKGKVGGYPEHSFWYKGLRNAKAPVTPLKLIETNRRRPLRDLIVTEEGVVECPIDGDDATDSEESDSEDAHSQDMSDQDSPEDLDDSGYVSGSEPLLGDENRNGQGIYDEVHEEEVSSEVSSEVSEEE